MWKLGDLVGSKHASSRMVLGCGVALAAASVAAGCASADGGEPAPSKSVQLSPSAVKASAAANKLGVASWEVGGKGVLRALDTQGVRILEVKFRPLPNKEGVAIREIFPANGSLIVKTSGGTVVHDFSPSAVALVSQAVADLKDQPVAYGCWGSHFAASVACAAAIVEAGANLIADGFCAAAMVAFYEDCIEDSGSSSSDDSGSGSES